MDTKPPNCALSTLRCQARERTAGPERKLLHYAALRYIARQREIEPGAGFFRRLQYGCEM